MHRTFALALALAAFPAAQSYAARADEPQMVTLSPAQIGEIFCMAAVGNDMAPVVGLQSPDLTQAIADAGRKNADWLAANPGDKPPLGDGIPWQSVPDYAPQCTVAGVTPVADGVAVRLTYAFPDWPDDGFTDTLYLVAVDQGLSVPFWRIDNVEYANGGDLKSVLVSVFTDQD